MIYFMQAGKNGPIKIGETELPHDRVFQLQVGCPYKLRLLFVYNGRHFDELGLHHYFRKEHIRGEWFRPVDAIKHFNRYYKADCYRIGNFELHQCREDELDIKYDNWCRDNGG